MLIPVTELDGPFDDPTAVDVSRFQQPSGMLSLWLALRVILAARTRNPAAGISVFQHQTTLPSSWPFQPWPDFSSTFRGPPEHGEPFVLAMSPQQSFCRLAFKLAYRVRDHRNRHSRHRLHTE